MGSQFNCRETQYLKIMNWSEFFNMGGYAVYVWTSWALSLAVFVYHILQAKLAKAKLIRDIKRQYQREQLLQDQEIA